MDPTDPMNPSGFSPWSWIPSSWMQPAPANDELPPIGSPAPVEAPPVPAPQEAAPPAPMQPGLPIPARAVESAPMPEVDAVSGVDALPPMPPQPEEPAPEVPQPEAPPSAYIDPLDPSTWSKPVGAADLYAMAKRDPVAYAQHTAAMDDAANREADRQAKEAEERTLVEREQNERDLKDALAEAQKRQQALMNTEIDPGRFRKNQTIPQSIASFLSVVIGGLYQARKGGPNIGLEMLDKAIEQDIAAQTANLNKERNAITMLRETGMSDFEAREAIRIGAYKQALAQIESKKQDFDPAGSTARRLTEQQLEIEGRIAQSAEAARRAFVDEELKRRKDQRETLETMAKLREADAKYAAQMNRMSGGGGTSTKPEDVPQSPDYFAAKYGEEGRPPTAMSEKEYATKWLPTAKKVQDLGAEGRRTQLEREVPGLKQADGSPFIARGTPESVELLRKKVAATKTVVRLMDEALRIRTGWTSDTAQSEEWQQLKANWAAAQGVAKDVLGLGALSGPDMELVNRFIGSNDPTGFRDPDAGIKKARQNLINLTRDSLEGAGFTGKFDIPRTNLSAPVESPSDRAFKKSQRITPAFEQVAKSGGDLSLDDVVPPDVQNTIVGLAAAARDADNEKEREEALKKLQNLVDTGGNEGIKQAARNALLHVGTESTSFDEAAGRSSQTARETIPPPRGK